MDVCELGERELPIGEVCRARILGAFCVADMHKFDWKIFALNEHEADTKTINSLSDYEAINPRKIKRIMAWFNSYKASESKEDNVLLLNSKVLSKVETLEVVKRSHLAYRDLILGKKKSLNSPIWIPDRIK